MSLYFDYTSLHRVVDEEASKKRRFRIKINSGVGSFVVGENSKIDGCGISAINLFVRSISLSNRTFKFANYLHTSCCDYFPAGVKYQPILFNDSGDAW